jgi:hypothetical protein
MVNNFKNRRAPDRSRIKLNKKREVRYWTRSVAARMSLPQQ